MRIAIDLRPLLEPYESGVTVYTKFMVQALSRHKGIELDLFYQAANRCPWIHKLFPSVRHVPLSNSSFHLRSLFSFPKLPSGFFLKAPDLIWLPDRRPFYKTEIPVVMTIHDLVPEKCPRSLSFKSSLWHHIFSLRRLLGLGDGFLVPSYSIKVDLVTEKPLEVTYEGAKLTTELVSPSLPKKFKSGRFFLSISPADPRKRLIWILNAAKKFPNMNFVIAGVKPNDKRFSKYKMKSLKNLFILNAIDEREKTWLLRHARALLSLSEYEGFDLPVLEAIQAKCPVILSDIAVHRELYTNKDGFISNEPDLHVALYRANEKKTSIPKPRRSYTWDEAAKTALLFFRRVIVHKNS